MKIIALEESFWYDKLATDGSTARAWLQLKSAVAADWQRKLVDFTEYRLPDMDRNGVDMQVLSLNSPGIQVQPDPDIAVADALVVLSCRRGQARATASPQGTLSRTSRSLRLGDARSPRRGRGSLLRQKLQHKLGTAEPVREDSDVPSQRPGSPGRHVVRVGAAA